MSHSPVGSAAGRHDPSALDGVDRHRWHDLWDAAVPDAVEEHAMEQERFGPVQASVVVEEPEAEMVNHVLCAAEPGVAENGHLEEAVDWMESRVAILAAKRLSASRSNGDGMSSLATLAQRRPVDPTERIAYRVPVTPGLPGTAAAEDWLRRSGFEPDAGWPRLVRDASAPGFEGGESYRVTELELDQCESMFDVAGETVGMDAWADSWFFELPDREGWHCYFALAPEGLPHSFGATLIVDGVASFGMTPDLGPDRREAQLALLRRRILDAALAGCHILFADAPDEGSFELLREAGFEEAYRRRNWRPVRRRWLVTGR